MPFTFPGMIRYIRTTMERHPNLTRFPEVEVLVPQVDAISKVGKALSQATLASEADRAAIMEGATIWREVLAIAMEVIESAIAETSCELELPTPDFLIDQYRNSAALCIAKEALALQGREMNDRTLGIAVGQPKFDEEDVETYLPKPRTRRKLTDGS